MLPHFRRNQLHFFYSTQDFELILPVQGIIADFGNGGLEFSPGYSRDPRDHSPLPTLAMSLSPASVIQAIHEAGQPIHNAFWSLPGMTLVSWVRALPKARMDLNFGACPWAWTSSISDSYMRNTGLWVELLNIWYTLMMRLLWDSEHAFLSAYLPFVFLADRDSRI